jgi:hypothetical protein
MHKIAGLKVHLKLLITLAVVAMLIAVVFVNIRMTGEQNSLNEAVEGGELALTAVSRSYESLTHFVQENQSQAEELLKAARVSIENAEKKLGSAGRTRDTFTIRMVSNYKIISGASEAMAQGVDNLLAINGELQNALTFYNQGEYVNSAEQASQALNVLTPLLIDLDKLNSSLDGLNYNSIASGHRDRVTLAVGQYQSGQKIYLQYILLLKSLLEGKDYLETREVIDEKLRQLQRAIANEDYATAQKLLQEINDLLQTLKDPRFDNATETASQLEPELLEGNAFDAAQDLKTRLKDLAGIQQFETYLQGLERFVASSVFLAQGEPQAAEQAANEGIGILGPGQPYLSDPELQRLYEGLGQAFNSLLMRIKGQPDLG